MEDQVSVDQTPAEYIPAGALPRWWVNQFGKRICHSTLDAAKGKDQGLMLYRHVNSRGSPVSDFLNKRVKLVHFTLFPAAITAEDGEVKEFIGCMMQTDEGVLIQAGSRGIAKSLVMLTELLRPAPWDPPMEVEIRNAKTRDGHNFYVLDPVAEPTTTAAASKKK